MLVSEFLDLKMCRFNLERWTHIKLMFINFLTLLGHDLGIEAILVVLGIKMDHHVPYASRLVFEYWTEKQTKTTKIRKRFSRPDLL